MTTSQSIYIAIPLGIIWLVIYLVTIFYELKLINSLKRVDPQLLESLNITSKSVFFRVDSWKIFRLIFSRDLGQINNPEINKYRKVLKTLSITYITTFVIFVIFAFLLSIFKPVLF